MADIYYPTSVIIWIVILYIIARLILRPKKRIITSILILYPWLPITINLLYTWFNIQMWRLTYFYFVLAPVLLSVSIMIMDIIWQYHNYNKQNDDLGTSIHLGSKKRFVSATLVVPVLLLISTPNTLRMISWITFFGIDSSTIMYLLMVLIPETVVVLMLTTEIVYYLLKHAPSLANRIY